MDEQTSFNLTDLPLGSIAACDVSDEVMWTHAENDEQGGESKLSTLQMNALSGMRETCAKAETQARRLEIELAWLLRLMDRGFHYIFPGKQGGWVLTNPASKGQSPYVDAIIGNRHPLNIIGAKNDIIVSALTREIPGQAFFPKFPNSDTSITAAGAANNYKLFLADENCYAERAGEAARLMCTDDRVVFYMRPVADAQQFGYEDEAQDAVPETEEQLPEGGGHQKPRIRQVLSVYGKLEHKTQIVSANGKSPYEQLYEEMDVATARGMAPWVADQITGGDVGTAEVQLDRMARCSIKLALKGTYSTGDSLMRDVTVQRTWLRPEMFLDDSCPKTLREFFFGSFPKGCLVVYVGKVFAYCRNESPDEVLTVLHARTGSGQNRRAITEAYAGPNLRLNNWNELLDQKFRKSIPRTFYDKNMFNVPALRAASATVGAIDPFDAQAAGLVDPKSGILQSPVASVEQTIPDAIQYFAGPLAEELTGAQPSMAGSQDDDDPETLGQSRLQNAQAMGRLSEPYQALRSGFCRATKQGVSWAPRVMPQNAKLERSFGSKRVSVEVSDIDGDLIECVPEGEGNIPESYEERKQVFRSIWSAAEANPNGPSAAFLSNPINRAKFKEFLPKGATIDGVDAVEKQQGEFEVLMSSAPQPNPQFMQLQQMLEQAQQDPTIQIDPQKQQALQQIQQQAQSTPPEVSSVKIKPTDNHPIEAMVTLSMINSAEGRKLATSPRPQDQAGFQNLTLHYQEHDAEAKKTSALNAQPIPPRTSITVAADKLPPQAQAGALAKAGIPIQPEQLQGDMQPHEQKIEQEHIDPMTGAKTKTTQAVMNPEH
jgi:hypothetical protein